MEFFPQVDQIRQALDAQRGRPAQWRETNLAMIREFVDKLSAVGIEPPTSSVWGKVRPQGAEMGPVWQLAPPLSPGRVYLSPGPPPSFWVTATENTGTFYDPLEDVTHEEDLEELEQLSLWDPRLLHDTLVAYLPR